MFFKRKISVDEYCKTRLDLLFSDQQTQVWLQLKQSWPDYINLSASDHLYLTHLRAAHIEILLMVVIKKFALRNNIYDEVEECIDNYLNEDNESNIIDILPLYSRALGSSSIDGILSMAKFMATNICNDKCPQETILSFRVQLYGAIDSIRADFKKVKIVSHRNDAII
jgi:hypothetical protein